MTRPDLIVDLGGSPEIAFVALRGELDVHAEPRVRAALEQAMAQAPHVVLDLRGLEFIDSAGIKLALVFQRRLQDHGVAFSIVRGAPHVHRPFSSAGLDGLLPFVDGPPA